MATVNTTFQAFWGCLRYTAVAFFVWLAVMPATAMPRVAWTDSTALRPDSSNFVTASLLVISPDDNIDSSFGHCALRMECPTQDLDYCFSFETESNAMSDYFKFFTGQLNGKVVAVPTDVFCLSYVGMGRGIEQHVLNLTLREQQTLWQLLDEDMVSPDLRKFNFLQNNCTSVLLTMVGYTLSLHGEHLSWDKLPPMVQLSTGKGVRYLSRHSLWYQFVFATFLGTESDKYWPVEQRMSPETVGESLQGAHIATDGNESSKRKAVVSERTMFPVVKEATSTGWATPCLVFGLLLLVVIVITAGQLLWNWCKLPRLVDITLFVTQTLAGIILSFVAVKASLFGSHANWYLIPFNPIPALLWMCCRHRAWYGRVWWLYAGVLLAFLAATPLSNQIDVAHQLITATLLVRCMAQIARRNSRSSAQ